MPVRPTSRPTVTSIKGLLVRFASAATLFVVALVCLGFGDPSKEALAGAGFAILGAALLRTVEAFREHRDAEASRRDRRLKDLDETRRHAYRSE